MKYTIYLLRHPHIDTKKTMIGRKDMPLSIKGEKQALYWKEYFKDIFFDKIFVSPLQRTKQAAEIITDNQVNNKFEIIDDFCEISLGLWEGMKKEEVKQHYSLDWKKRGEDFYSAAPPFGESFFDLEQRVLPAFTNICNDLLSFEQENDKEEKNILIVSHQAVNRILLAEIFSLSKDKILEISQDYACLNVLELGKSVNDIKYIERKDCPIL